ncbi:HAD family hydrolase [Kribbella sp. DT2]|uniref:HAD family hydrolase n=1 Tax=Kribbella sp. DT2 TaxID=3393427 RepID=UPI003CF4BD2E
MTTDPLKEILSNAEAVLFDFDGPICSVFDGYPAQQIADELRELAHKIRGKSVSALDRVSSPHELLLAAASDPELAQRLEAALQEAELAAVRTALPTPGAAESIAACNASGRVVAIVSNNYGQAVTDYLARIGLAEQVAYIVGRNATDPTLMKPSPHLIEKAIQALNLESSDCVFVGDQTTDIEAGRAAGVPTIGYANKPGKVDALQSVGADVVLTGMLELAEAIH